MNINKKKTIINIFLFCFLVTAHVLFEVFFLKNEMSLLRIIAKYGVAIITGILLEVYCELIKASGISKKFNKEMGYLSLLKISMFYGIVFFGGGMFIFFLIFSFFILGQQININNFILFFTTWLIGGAAFGLIIFIAYSIINIVKKRKDRLEVSL